VVFGLESGQLFAANLRAAARHHDRGVPTENGHGAAKGMEPFPFLFELLVWGEGHGEPPGINGRQFTSEPPSHPSRTLEN
jgi:hypothetical protein